MFVVLPKGGLCNRLRVIFSCLKKSRLENKEMLVFWVSSNECPGFFLDYFQPIDGVTFSPERQKKVGLDYRGSAIIPEFPPDYKELKVLPYLKTKIDGISNLYENNYLALHIRRTDHLKCPEKMSDERFIHYVKKNINNYNGLYIATDNRETQDKFLEIFGNHIKYIKMIPKDNEDLRKTSIADAVIDLYICVKSSIFKGNNGSSFTGLINKLRD